MIMQNNLEECNIPLKYIYSRNAPLAYGINQVPPSLLTLYLLKYYKKLENYVYLKYVRVK